MMIKIDADGLLGAQLSIGVSVSALKKNTHTFTCKPQRVSGRENTRRTNDQRYSGRHSGKRDFQAQQRLQCYCNASALCTLLSQCVFFDSVEKGHLYLVLSHNAFGK